MILKLFFYHDTTENLLRKQIRSILANLGLLSTNKELDFEIVNQIKSTLIFSQIFPFSNVQLVTRKRKLQQSQIITSSPFKKAFVNHKPINKYKPIASQTKQMLKYHKQQAPKKIKLILFCILNHTKILQKRIGSNVQNVKRGVMKTKKSSLFVTFVCLEITSFCLT